MKQTVGALQSSSLAGDLPLQLSSRVAECPSLLKVFDLMVNLRCSICFVKPAKGGKAQVKAAPSLGWSRSLDLISASYVRLWFCFSVFQNNRK